MYSLHLMWNGEVYSGIDMADDGNDGFAVLLALAEEYARVHNMFPGDEFLPEFSQRDAYTLNCRDESDSVQCLHAAAMSEFDSGWLAVSPIGIWQWRAEQLLKCSSIPQAHLFPWIIPPIVGS
jgi:hypothetical protein